MARRSRVFGDWPLPTCKGVASARIIAMGNTMASLGEAVFPARLDCGSCILRPWQLDEDEVLQSSANNVRIWQNLRDVFPHPYTLTDASTWLNQNAGVVPPRGAYAIDVGGDAVGTIALQGRTDVERLSAEIGYWVAEPHWGKGLATSAVTALCRHVFDHTNLVRVDAPVFARNAASMRVLEKAGFVREAILRRARVKDGQLLDAVVYALVRETELPYLPA